MIPKPLSFLCRALLSIPTKLAVLDIFPLNFLSWIVKYSFSNFSLASFNGTDKLFSAILSLKFWFFRDSLTIFDIFSDSVFWWFYEKGKQKILRNRVYQKDLVVISHRKNEQKDIFKNSRYVSFFVFWSLHISLSLSIRFCDDSTVTLIIYRYVQVQYL